MVKQEGRAAKKREKKEGGKDEKRERERRKKYKQFLDVQKMSMICSSKNLMFETPE